MLNIRALPCVWTYLCHNVQSQHSFIHDDESNDGLKTKGYKSVDPECQSVALHGEVGRNLKSKMTKCSSFLRKPLHAETVIDIYTQCKIGHQLFQTDKNPLLNGETNWLIS